MFSQVECFSFNLKLATKVRATQMEKYDRDKIEA
jgi:hypothetical protein